MSDSPLFDGDSERSTLSENDLLDLGFRSHGEPADVPMPSSEKAGDVFGHYRLLALLGEGGFGTVWRAEQTEPIRREVALKVIKPGLDSREISARFEAERQALALMDHPHIAAVLDVGTTETGRPYFAMELVKGEPITTYCDGRRLGIAERLALYIPVCQAIQHAHQKSILHRDLKPSNILVATVDGRPVPKVIDFGIAKALGGNEGAAPAGAALTRLGVVVGTPRYMSPEQAGSAPDVDTRSDIYSLGVVLCELLTGQTPYPSPPANFGEALRWIRETEPVKPSTLAQNATAARAQAAARRGTDPRRLARSLRGDLDWITLKTLEKERTRRYETATALARDLERHLEGEPVSAVAPTWHYQFGKFARRHRAALVAACLVFLALVGGTVASLGQASRAERNRREADRRYAQTRDAVDKYLVRVTDHPKLKEANFVDLQRDLLEAAVPFYEEMSQYQGEDPKLRTDRAYAMGRLAWLYENEGKMEKAEAAYRQATSVLAKLSGEFPKEPDHQRQLGLCHTELAMLLQQQGRMDEAMSEHDQAVSVEEALLSRVPVNPQCRCSLAKVLNNRATTLGQMHRGEEAVEVLKRASALGGDLCRQFPDSAEYRAVLVTSMSGVGDYLFQQHRFEEAAGQWRLAVANYDFVISRGWATARESSFDAARARTRLGLALTSSGQLTEAEAVLQRAVSQFRSMTEEFPTNRNFRENLNQAQEALQATLLAGQQTSGPGPAPPPPPLGRQPRKFTFAYSGPDPGPRQWRRESETWTETQPSGMQNVSTVVGPAVVNGIPGTTLGRKGFSGLSFFVPDVGADKPMRLWLKKADGIWKPLGEMAEVE